MKVYEITYPNGQTVISSEPPKEGTYAGVIVRS